MKRTALATLLAVAAAAACSSFQVAQPESNPSADAGLDGNAPGTDAALPEGGPGIGRFGCTPARAPTCDPATGCAVSPLFSSPNTPENAFGITTDADTVYWVAQAGGENPLDGFGIAKIYAIAKTGGERRSLAVEQRRVTAIALDGNTLYWVALTSAAPPSWELRGVDRSCGLATGPACKVRALGIVAGDDDEISDLRMVRPGQLAVLTGQGHVRLVDVQPFGVADPADTDDRPGLAVTPDVVFASSPQNLTVTRVDMTTRAASLLSPLPASGGESGPRFLATDCDDLFALRNGEKSRDVFRFREGPPELVVGFPNDFDPQAFAADARYLYAPGKFGLYVIDPAEKTASFRPGPETWRIAVDDDGVYYGDHKLGTLYVLRKR